MTLHDFVTMLRVRWITVAVTTLVALLGATALTLLTTPLYEASTRLFVSSSTGDERASDLYQGNRLSCVPVAASCLKRRMASRPPT